tara:strand:+ start:492 stop:761 length:270 start_codon:yes stop_codon:yes gene_type:complete
MRARNAATLHANVHVRRLHGQVRQVNLSDRPFQSLENGVDLHLPCIATKLDNEKLFGNPCGPRKHKHPGCRFRTNGQEKLERVVYVSYL